MSKRSLAGGFLVDFTAGGNNWPGKKVPVKCRSHAVTLHISDIKRHQTSQTDIKRLQTSNDITHIRHHKKTSKDFRHQMTSNDITIIRHQKTWKYIRNQKILNINRYQTSKDIKRLKTLDLKKVMNISDIKQQNTKQTSNISHRYETPEETKHDYAHQTY